MAKRTRTQIASDISTKLANNTAGDISPQDVREIVTDLSDSAVNLIDDGRAPLNADWSPADTNFIVEGDSIAAGWGDFSTISALSGKTNFFNVSVSGSYIGATDGSGIGHNIFATNRYTDNVYPKRPAANGGTAGITRSILFLMVGTNNNYDLALTRYATYIATAKSHGFTVIVCTVYATTGFNASGGPTPYTPEAARWYGEFNRGIYDGTAGAHYIVPIDQIFRGIGDPGIAGDNLHLTTPGNDRSKALINRVLLSDGSAYTPTATLTEIGRVKGAMPGGIMTHDSAFDMPHAYRAAQGPQITPLTFAADFVWPVDFAQAGAITLTGAVTSVTPTGQVSGTAYELWVKHNGHAITWTHPVVFASGVSTTASADTAHSDYYRFVCKDAVLVCVDHKTGIDLTPPPEPGVIVSEGFLQTGAASPGVALHGTQADIAGVSGQTWVSVNYSEFNKGVIRTFNANRKGSGGTTTYNAGISDNVEIEIQDVYFGSGSWANGLVLKAAAQTELSTNTTTGPQWIFLSYISQSGTRYVGLKSQGSGGTGDLMTTVTASSLGIVEGDTLRITIIGSTLRLYRNDETTPKVTATLPAGVASNTIYGFYSQGGSTVTSFKIKDLAG